MGGGTLAYLTDTETADNTFTVGKVKIDLEEPNYPGNDSDEVKAIVPNQTVAKDPQIENTGNNEAIVYLKVEVPQEEYTELGADNVPGEKKLQDLFSLKDVSDQWELIRTETTTTDDGKTKTSYIYAYKKPLGKGETTDKLFQKVQMKNSMESDLAGKVEDIIVTAYAIQSTDVSDISLTPAEDGTLGKDILNQVYEIFLNQSGQETPRPADEGNRPQNGKLGKINYVLAGGELPAGALTEYSEDNFGYTPPVPTKEGYIFTGWSPENISTDSQGLLTFTATWKKTKTTTAQFLDGSTLNVKMKTLAGNDSVQYSTTDTYIKAIKHSNAEPSDAIKSDDACLVSTDNSEDPIYMWFEDGTIYWWSEADYFDAGSNLNNLCYDMQSLVDIDGLSDWDTSNVKTMVMTFFRCHSITDLTPIANWNLGNTTSLKNIFNQCKSLADISSLKNWNINNVTNMSRMFYWTSIVDLTPISEWNMENVQDMEAMFGSCSLITDLTPIANWDVSNVSNIKYLFTSCSGIVSLKPIANWNISKVRSLEYTFSGCRALTNLSGLENWDVAKITDLHGTFQYCTNLKDPSAINDWDITNVFTFSNLFFNSPKYPTWSKREGTWYGGGTFIPTT